MDLHESCLNVLTVYFCKLGEHFKALFTLTKNSKVVPSYLLAQHTHSLVSDQVMFNGGTAIVLLDPVDLNTIAHLLDLGF